ncbi:MAG: hypothetical protein J6Q51_02310, partial [Clostridia bacterium]|nr:hypothetical protein [Clostridia bacterium]
TLYGVNVGGAFGSINEIRISGKVNKDPDTMPESKITLSNAIGCDIGGLVGETLNGEINNLSIKPTIKTVTEIVDKNLSNIIYNSNIGGVSGYNRNTKYYNIIVGSYEKVTVDDKAVINRDGEISFNAISKYDGSDNVYANVGALTGFSENASIKEINNVETYIDINLVLNGETGKTNQIRAGGIAGILQNVGMENISTYGDIMVSNITPCDNAKKSYGNLYIAGLVALAKNVDITKGIATGNLKNNVGFELYQGINILQMAGLIAKADGEISLENCVAAGNTYPMYNVTVKEDGEGKLSTEEEISVGFNGSLIDAPKTCTQFMYGGLIADISSKTLTNVNLVSNYSIDSLVNKTDDEFVKGEKDARDYYANAFIGLTKNDENDNIEKVNTSTKNKFAHSYTMVLNNNSIKDSDNVLLSEIIPEIQTIIVGEDVSKLTSGKHDYFIIGSKINYQTNLTEEETEVENKYVYLNETQNQLGKAINLKNAIVVADGSDILFAPENNKLSTFGTIDKNSIVSGVRVLANYTVEKEDGFKEKLKSDNVISGFADVNQGIVYSCVVRGGATNNIIPGTIHSRKNPVSGFVNNNGGLIKDSFVEANMISNETDLLVSAFVRENSGYIVTCYASGSIQSPKANSNRRISAFGPGGVYGCYSIVKIVGDNITDYELVRFVFDVEKTAIVKKSYYDMYAVEASLYWDKNTNFNSEKNYGKTTDQLSATYKDSEAAQTKLNSGE